MDDDLPQDRNEQIDELVDNLWAHINTLIINLLGNAKITVFDNKGGESVMPLGVVMELDHNIRTNQVENLRIDTELQKFIDNLPEGDASMLLFGSYLNDLPEEVLSTVPVYKVEVSPNRADESGNIEVVTLMYSEEINDQDSVVQKFSFVILQNDNYWKLGFSCIKGNSFNKLIELRANRVGRTIAINFNTGDINNRVGDELSNLESVSQLAINLITIVSEGTFIRVSDLYKRGNNSV
jgi:hypothetical protein